MIRIVRLPHYLTHAAQVKYQLNYLASKDNFVPIKDSADEVLPFSVESYTYNHNHNL